MFALKDLKIITETPKLYLMKSNSPADVEAIVAELAAVL